ncbi:MAG TPA: iron ABC transporter permease [Aliidongia sp.]|uniref:FecCD family ABC transporter permease n=1 Tax=Aliidongia sp. TaxID=1914230 RepID=UPI002DDCF815|nr:iron ABC transporter permease [Aliidongia sp.]HEV2678431.1 iron ABC transporter permease [Aliidongia sp.]
MRGLPLALIGLLVAVILVSTGIGPVWIPPATVARILADHLFGRPDPASATGAAAIVWELRLPRVLLGALVGGGLGLVGTSLQAATRNPLADPFLFGISSGAAFGAVLVMLHTGAALGPLTLSLAAFAGALLSMGVVAGIARRQGVLAPDRLILGGVGVSFVLMAATDLLIFAGDQRGAASVLFWMLGGLGRARWALLGMPAIVLAAGFAYLFGRARAMNALLAGDETAITLGVDVERLRLGLFIVSALVTAIMVALSGSIGFVGLMIPHIFRRLVGPDHRALLPAATLGGAIFLVAVDAGARTVLAPEDLPVGILTAALGGSFFLWQMRRGRG